MCEDRKVEVLVVQPQRFGTFLWIINFKKNYSLLSFFIFILYFFRNEQHITMHHAHTLGMRSAQPRGLGTGTTTKITSQQIFSTHLVNTSTH